jgi:hypothetical protein
MNATTLKDNLITQFRNKMAHLFVIVQDPMYTRKEGKRSSFVHSVLALANFVIIKFQSR